MRSRQRHAGIRSGRGNKWDYQPDYRPGHYWGMAENLLLFCQQKLEGRNIRDGGSVRNRRPFEVVREYRPDLKIGSISEMPHPAAVQKANRSVQDQKNPGWLFSGADDIVIQRACGSGSSVVDDQTYGRKTPDEPCPPASRSFHLRGQKGPPIKSG